VFCRNTTSDLQTRTPVTLATHCKQFWPTSHFLKHSVCLCSLIGQLVHCTVPMQSSPIPYLLGRCVSGCGLSYLYQDSHQDHTDVTATHINANAYRNIFQWITSTSVIRNLMPLSYTHNLLNSKFCNSLTQSSSILSLMNVRMKYLWIQIFNIMKPS